eukprot:Opistho-2@24860
MSHPSFRPSGRSVTRLFVLFCLLFCGAIRAEKTLEVSDVAAAFWLRNIEFLDFTMGAIESCTGESPMTNVTAIGTELDLVGLFDFSTKRPALYTVTLANLTRDYAVPLGAFREHSQPYRLFRLAKYTLVVACNGVPTWIADGDAQELVSLGNCDEIVLRRTVAGRLLYITPGTHGEETTMQVYSPGEFMQRTFKEHEIVDMPWGHERALPTALYASAAFVFHRGDDAEDEYDPEEDGDDSDDGTDAEEGDNEDDWDDVEGDWDDADATDDSSNSGVRRDVRVNRRGRTSRNAVNGKKARSDNALVRSGRRQREATRAGHSGRRSSARDASARHGRDVRVSAESVRGEQAQRQRRSVYDLIDVSMFVDAGWVAAPMRLDALFTVGTHPGFIGDHIMSYDYSRAHYLNPFTCMSPCGKNYVVRVYRPEKGDTAQTFHLLIPPNMRAAKSFKLPITANVTTMTGIDYVQGIHAIPQRSPTIYPGNEDGAATSTPVDGGIAALALAEVVVPDSDMISLRLSLKTRATYDQQQAALWTDPTNNCPALCQAQQPGTDFSASIFSRHRSLAFSLEDWADSGATLTFEIVPDQANVLLGMQTYDGIFNQNGTAGHADTIAIIPDDTAPGAMRFAFCAPKTEMAASGVPDWMISAEEIAAREKALTNWRLWSCLGPRVDAKSSDSGLVRVQLSFRVARNVFGPSLDRYDILNGPSPDSVAGASADADVLVSYRANRTYEHVGLFAEIQRRVALWQYMFHQGTYAYFVGEAFAAKYEGFNFMNVSHLPSADVARLILDGVGSFGRYYPHPASDSATSTIGMMFGIVAEKLDLPVDDEVSDLLVPHAWVASLCHSIEFPSKDASAKHGSQQRPLVESMRKAMSGYYSCVSIPDTKPWPAALITPHSISVSGGHWSARAPSVTVFPEQDSDIAIAADNALGVVFDEAYYYGVNMFGIVPFLRAEYILLQHATLSTGFEKSQDGGTDNMSDDSDDSDFDNGGGGDSPSNNDNGDNSDGSSKKNHKAAIIVVAIVIPVIVVTMLVAGFMWYRRRQGLHGGVHYSPLNQLNLSDISLLET